MHSCWKISRNLSQIWVVTRENVIHVWSHRHYRIYVYATKPPVRLTFWTFPTLVTRQGYRNNMFTPTMGFETRIPRCELRTFIAAVVISVISISEEKKERVSMCAKRHSRYIITVYTGRCETVEYLLFQIVSSVITFHNDSS